MHDHQLTLFSEDPGPRIIRKRCPCGKTFETTGTKRAYCRECATINARRLRQKHKASDPQPRDSRCYKCGTTFQTRSYHRTLCSQCHSVYSKKYRVTLIGALSIVFNSCKRNRNRKGELRDFRIDFDYIKGLLEEQAGRCALSGMQMTGKPRDLRRVSIDRKDSSLGYIPGNIQLVCKWANVAKGNRPDCELIEIIEEIRASSP
jgi:hypothetical protein